MGIPTPEWVNVLFSALGGLGIGGYAVWRKVGADLKGDKLDEKHVQIITSLEQQLSSERELNKHQREVIDRVAKERNEAVQKVGRLEGSIQALESQIAHLQNQVTHLEADNKRLMQRVGDMSDKFALVSEQLAKLLGQGGDQ